MTTKNLRTVTDEVIRRAEQQGSILAREIRDELTRVGLDGNLYKDVLALARPSLSYRRGRYHYTAPVSDRVRAEQSRQDAIRTAVERIIQEQRAALARQERREQGRIDFIHPVRVRTEDGQEFTLLTRDLSLTGIRLVGTRRLLGQKVFVRLPVTPQESLEFHVRILWTCPIGEDLIENGGSLLSVSGSIGAES